MTRTLPPALRVVACLLICVTLFMCSPIRAEAVALEMLLIDAFIVVGGIFLGLGLYQLTGTDAWQNAVSNCVQDLKNLTNFIVDGQIEMVKINNANERQRTFAKLELIEWVRNWIFEQKLVQAMLSVGGFTCPTIGASYGTYSYGPFNEIGYLYPEQMFSLLRSLGVNENVMILAQSNDDYKTIRGYYFDETGLLRVGNFSNPLGFNHSSLYGIHPLSNLQLVSSESPGLYPFNESGYYSWPIYFSREYAEASDGWLYKDCFAFDWDSEPSAKTNGSYAIRALAFKLWRKNQVDSNWLSYSKEYHFNSMGSYYCAPVNGIVFDEINDIYIAPGLGSALIADPNSTLSDGYPDWVKDAYVDGDITYFPLGVTPDFDSMSGLTQEDVWTGSAFPASPIIGTQDYSAVVQYQIGDTARPLYAKAYSPDGGTLTYQWYCDGFPIAGQTALAFLPPTDAEGVHNYSCLVGNFTTASEVGTYAWSWSVRVEVYADAVPDTPAVTTPLEGASDADTMQGAIADSKVELGTITDSLADASVPDYAGKIDLGFSKIFGSDGKPGPGFALAAGVLEIIFSNDGYIFWVYLFAFTLAAIAFVVFGKRS